MTDFLVDHARQHVWCTPDQDLQVTLKPVKLSRPLGELLNARVLWEDIPMPTKKDRYHLYQIGQVHPDILGLLPTKMIWRTVKDNMRENKLYCDVYTVTGRHLPRFECWFLVNQDNNVILAIKSQTAIADLDKEEVFVRLYSNAFFQSVRSNPQTNEIACEGQRFTDTNQMLFMQRRYREYRAKPGLCLAFVNGWLVDDFPPQMLAAGDAVEYVYDSSVKATYDFEVPNLQTFDSTLDSKTKYLLHYVPQLKAMIDYLDDIDFYLVRKDANGRYTGAYYHKNAEDAVRMVTHKDYSLPVMYVNAIRDDSKLWTSRDTITIRMHLRNAGWERSLVNEHHRIKELYKLGEPELTKALLGIDSNIWVWQAANLEKSMYPAIMRDFGPTITKQMVTEAYGYNATSKLLGDTPQKVVVNPNRSFVDLPPGLHRSATVYEYNQQGALLGFYTHTLGPTYKTRNAAARLVEAIYGRGGVAAPVVYGDKEVPVIAGNNYRMYKTRIWRGVIQDDEWQEATINVDYTIQNNVVRWLTDDATYTAVMRDTEFLAYSFSMTPIDGILKFSIVAEQKRLGSTYTAVMPIPGGRLEVWLNGRALIENLDFVCHWPQVVITNKSFWSESATQNLVVRVSGFCTKEMKLETPVEYGFVEYGLLSRNNRFNVRDDRVLRVLVEGTLRHRDELIFAEDDVGVSMQNIRNGAPYQITDIVVPMQGLTSKDTYSMRAESHEVDQLVEDYLTIKLPQKPKTPPSPFPGYYLVYSPFTCKIMYDMVNGVIDFRDWMDPYSDMQVRQAMEDYVYLLDYDPVKVGVDTQYVNIQPHQSRDTVVLNIYQYRLLERVIKVFLDGKVDINKFIQIKEGYV